MFIATTRIIPMHYIAGKSILQCLSERIDYALDDEKTADREYVSSYKCDPDTAASEFALSKREYFTLTGRRQDRDVIAYPIRQSFKPGEISAEEANRIGYEFAERFLKSNHALSSVLISIAATFTTISFGTPLPRIAGENSETFGTVQALSAS